MNPQRWHDRFDNFTKALRLLEEACEKPNLSVLEQQGLIQRLEMTLELAWKTMKDYLRGAGVTLDIIAPAPVIREAFKANLITRADIWMDALETRNKLSHTYDESRFLEATQAIKYHYIIVFKEFFEKLHHEHSKP
jgi:nucleotidyltransferase substrate binding protein (TIGR01987 family)